MAHSDFNITLNDNSSAILTQLNMAKAQTLEQCGLMAEGFAKDLCPVDTGNLRNSITHTVDGNTMTVGTATEYSTYVEMGTGKYATNGNGRPTPWVYPTGKLDKNGNMIFCMTHGQKPQPFIKPSVADHIATYQAIFEKNIKG